MDVFQLARELLALLACRMTPDGFGNAAGEEGMATTGMVLREGGGGGLHSPAPRLCSGSSTGTQLQSIAIAPFHHLCCELTNTASSGTVETRKEPSREQPSSTAEAQMYIYIFLNANSCTLATSKYHFAQQTFIPCSLITQVREHNRRN